MTAMTKTDAIKKLEKIVLRYIKLYDLSHEEVQKAIGQARKEAGVTMKKRGVKLPQLLSENELNRFFNAVGEDKNPSWELLFRLLLATACRVSELAHIRKHHVNFQECRIFIEQGKGNKDGYVPFPAELALPLRQQITKTDVYLFESRKGKAYSTRAIQRKMDHYAIQAGIVDSSGRSRMNPHLFRHQTITYLLAKGMPLEQVRKISRHSSLDSFQIYEHLNFTIAHDKYQQIMSGMERR